MTFGKNHRVQRIWELSKTPPEKGGIKDETREPRRKFPLRHASLLVGGTRNTPTIDGVVKDHPFVGKGEIPRSLRGKGTITYQKWVSRKSKMGKG
ncbi:hypothetical protein LIER_40554 [Lithospermum erythrorhizon]|uniref:Uncharacterized protein n=1 Tax=Lithospermum erythrorhizon TaxID=34254 RepID=A0AAV3R0H0_LITER